MSKVPRIMLIPMIFVLVFLFSASLFAAAPNETQATGLKLKIVPQSSEPVPAGKPAVFYATLKDDSDDVKINALMQLSWDTDLVESVDLQAVPGETMDVRTDRVRREAGKATWKGDFKPGGQITIRVALKPALCQGALVIALKAEAGLAAAPKDRISAEDSLKVNCPANDLSEKDFNFVKKAYDLNPNDLSLTTADVLKGTNAGLKIELTNKSGQTVNAIVTDALEPKSGQQDQCRVVASQVRAQTSGAPTLRFDRGYLPPGSLMAAEDLSDAYIAFMILELKPGETWTADLRVPLRGRIPGCEFSGKATFYPAPANPIPGSCDGGSPDCRYSGWTPRRADMKNLTERLTAYDSNNIMLRVVAPDLGDAPASENNFNEKMQAYSGIVADFPTVYNFNIGFPPELNNSDSAHREAPIHFQSHALRLGQLVSIEREADLNPNRNINPETGRANLDTRDDGWQNDGPPASCQPFGGEITITVEQWAVDYLKKNGRNAYLNLLGDFNGDGDWEDAGKCDGKTAPEHVIINHPIDIVDLGAGQHTIPLPNNLGVPWSTDATWLRLTLSEKKAPLPLKSGDIAHGDGRGPENGYLLGETEDYRVRVGQSLDASAQGADLAVRIDAQSRVESIPHMETSLMSIQATEWLTHTTMIFNHLVKFGNLGDGTARDSSLVVMPDPALRDSEIELVVRGDIPWNPGFAVKENCGAGDPNCRLEIDLGNVPPGKFGNLNVTATVHCDPVSGEACKETSFKVQAQVQSKDDGSSGNNQASKSWSTALPAEWWMPPIISWPIPGTSSDSDITVRGTTWTGRTIDVFVDGNKSDDGGSDDRDGEWRVVINPGQGTHHIAASFKGKDNPTGPTSVTVAGKEELLLNPISLQFALNKDGKKYWFHPWDESGRVDPNGWQVPLISGAQYDVKVDASQWYCLTCVLSFNDTASLGLKIDESKLLTELTYSGEGRTFTGSFIADQSTLGKELALEISFEGQEQVYKGRTVKSDGLPRVVNGQNAVDGADFLIWQGFRVKGNQVVWVRPQMVNGQYNPRKTGPDGTFFFDVAPGLYRLEIRHSSLSQPYFTEPLRLQGPFPSRSFNIGMPPTLNSVQPMAATKVHQLVVDADGFNPSELAIRSGDTVQLQNIGLQAHGARSEDSSIDSGFIPSGGSHNMRFTQMGSYVLEDPQDPQNKVLVTVGAGLVLDEGIFMPSVMAP